MRKRKKQLLKFGTCVAGVAAIATIAAMIVGLAAYVGCRFIFECNCSEWPLVLGCHRSFDDFDVHVDVSKRVKLFPSEDTFFFEETAPRPGNVIRRAIHDREDILDVNLFETKTFKQSSFQNTPTLVNWRFIGSRQPQASQSTERNLGIELKYFVGDSSCDIPPEDRYNE
eukprot:gene2751-8129_t